MPTWQQYYDAINPIKAACLDQQQIRAALVVEKEATARANQSLIARRATVRTELLALARGVDIELVKKQTAQEQLSTITNAVDEALNYLPPTIDPDPNIYGDQDGFVSEYLALIDDYNTRRAAALSKLAVLKKVAVLEATKVVEAAKVTEEVVPQISIPVLDGDL